MTRLLGLKAALPICLRGAVQSGGRAARRATSGLAADRYALIAQARG